MALTLMAVWFLIGETHGSAGDTGFDAAARALRAEPAPAGGLYTSGVDDICRQVPATINAQRVGRFLHYRTRKCMPSRKLHREIQ